MAMEDPTKVNEGLRRAVALMTAWNESEEEDDTWYAVQLASQDLAGAIMSDKLLDESITLITGLMSLAGRLLAELERESGKPISEILQNAGTQAAD